MLRYRLIVFSYSYEIIDDLCEVYKYLNKNTVVEVIWLNARDAIKKKTNGKGMELQRFQCKIL